MNMLRQMCGHRRNDRIQNVCMWRNIDVIPIEEKMTKYQLKQFWTGEKKDIGGTLLHGFAPY